MKAKPTKRCRRGAFGAILGILQDPQSVVMTWALKVLLAGSGCHRRDRVPGLPRRAGAWRARADRRRPDRGDGGGSGAVRGPAGPPGGGRRVGPVGSAAAPVAGADGVGWAAWTTTPPSSPCDSASPPTPSRRRAGI